MRDTQRDDYLHQVMELTTTRRGLLRRSLLGLTGLGVAGTMVACGDDDEEPNVTGQGSEDPGEDPGIGEETGIGAEGEETEEADDSD